MMMVKVADFSKFPAGRFLSDGPFPGEEFREDWLFPALVLQKGVVTVNLDDTAGFGSSFLEEAFGGLVRCNRFSFEVLKERLLVVCASHPEFVDEVWRYITDAAPHTKCAKCNHITRPHGHEGCRVLKVDDSVCGCLPVGQFFA